MKSEMDCLKPSSPSPTTHKNIQLCLPRYLTGGLGPRFLRVALRGVASIGSVREKKEVK